jgi:hypothetical protein
MLHNLDGEAARLFKQCKQQVLRLDGLMPHLTEKLLGEPEHFLSLLRETFYRYHCDLLPGVAARSRRIAWPALNPHNLIVRFDDILSINLNNVQCLGFDCPNARIVPRSGKWRSDISRAAISHQLSARRGGKWGARGRRKVAVSLCHS